MVNCYILIWKALATRFSINFKVVAVAKVLHKLREFSVLHDARRIVPRWDLFLLLLLENVQ